MEPSPRLQLYAVNQWVDDIHPLVVECNLSVVTLYMCSVQYVPMNQYMYVYYQAGWLGFSVFLHVSRELSRPGLIIRAQRLRRAIIAVDDLDAR